MADTADKSWDGRMDLKTWEDAPETAVQPKKSKAVIENIISQIRFPNRKFRLIEKGDGYLLQLFYDEPDIDTGHIMTHFTRKWYISPYMTESEIVEAAFSACKRSMEHYTCEHFLYKGRRVYSPHFNVNGKIFLCDQKAFDARK